MNLEIGTRIDARNWHLITPGTRLQETYSGSGRGGDIFMLDSGMMSSYSRRWHSPVLGMIDYGLVVEEVPNFPRASRHGSLAAFKQKVGTVTYGQSQLHGVSRQPAIDAVGALGLHDRGGAIGVGMWVHSHDDRLVRRLRDHNSRHGGLLLGVGDPNYNWGEYGLWRDVEESAWIEGGMTRSPILTRVLAINNPETEEYLLDPAGNEDDEVARFKGTVWAMGVEAKRSQRWCPSFEASMSILGLGENVGITAQPVPQRPTLGRETPAVGTIAHSYEEQYALPEGAILMHPTSGEYDGDWCYIQRSNRPGALPTYGRGPGEQRGTVWLMGPNSGQHSTTLRVLWDGQGQMNLPIPSLAVLSRAPIGTVVVSGEYANDTSGFTKREDNRWTLTRNGGGGVTDTDFFTDGRTNWVFRSFPPMSEHHAPLAEPAPAPAVDPF